jgi:DNA repair exonuclease SbcCD ATPase subunit
VRLQQVQIYNTQIETIKTFLTDINYKSREEKYTQKEVLQKQIHEKDQVIMQLETETQKLQNYQQQKTAFQTSLNNLEQQIQKTLDSRKKILEERETIDKELQAQELEQLKEQLQTVTRILQTIHDIEQLIQDATATKNLVKDLQQQEKLLSNLYTILSKEILLIALDEYLPVLSEIINSFLVQVVDYQITMKITETAEKLELEAKIYDEKGEREVKSLSGGQRTILKLVRMLAISSYLQTPLLFLDETINNLDGETIGKVSEMLNNFVKQRTMKFYTVTHNVEIQEMDIWDEVVEV